jgi:hypothetical protein
MVKAGFRELGKSLKYGSLLAGVATAALAVIGTSPAWASGPVGDYPPNAEPGKCYEKVLIPQQYESYSEQIIDVPGRTETRVIPAVYGEELRQVIVREERTEFITIPATYKTISETVVIRPGSVRTETIPAVYETITERVLVREAHTEWRRGVPPDQRPGEPYKTKVLATGEVLCLVEVPAEYSMVTRQVLKSPPRTVQVQVPAETQVVTRQVIDQDARVEKRVIPAEYRSVKVRVIVTPERVETYTIPPVYKTVTKQRMISDTRFEWRVVVCNYESKPSSTPRYTPPAPRPSSYQTPAAPIPYGGGMASRGVNVSPQVVRDVQYALGSRGYYQGPRDGVMSTQTHAALTRFQSDRRIAVGAITSESLLALGVPLP